MVDHGELHAKMNPRGIIKVKMAQNGGGGGGTDNYNALSNKPSINGHVLIGDSDFEDLGLHFGTAAAKNSTNAVTADSTDLVESGAVKSAIDAAVKEIMDILEALDANNTEY